MPSNRKESESLSLAEKLLRAYEKSHPTADFGEVRNQRTGLEWVQRIMKQLEQNELRMKANDK